jgi:putative protease
MVNDYGSLELAVKYGYDVWGGYGLNTSNTIAGQFLVNHGVKRLTISQELDAGNIMDILESQASIEWEMTVHGPLCGMVSDLCLARVLAQENKDDCSFNCLNGSYGLRDEFGQVYKIYTDEKCRNYIFYPYDLCLFAYLAELQAAGLRHFRLECQYYPQEKLTEVFKIYRQVLQVASERRNNSKELFNRLLELFPDGLAAVPWIYGQR